MTTVDFLHCRFSFHPLNPFPVVSFRQKLYLLSWLDITVNTTNQIQTSNGGINNTNNDINTASVDDNKRIL